MFKKVFAILFFLLAFNFVFAENESEIFWTLLNQGKYEEVEEFLAKWEENSPTDPELFVSYFNYFLSKSMHEQMHVESFLPPNYDGQYIQGKNENGEYVYIYSIIEYDDELCTKAIEYIDKGISYNPTRFDMHLGKAKLYSMRGEYTNQLRVLQDVVELNKEYESKWLWTDNKSIKDFPGLDFENTIHEYISQWLNSRNFKAISCAKELALYCVDRLSNLSVFYNDAAVSCLYLGDFISAKNYFERGYENNTSDMLILLNLGYVCTELGEIEEAKAYYKIVEECSDSYYSELAKQRLSEF